MHYIRCCLFIFGLQAIPAMYQIQIPEVEFLSNNLRPIECKRFYKLLRRRRAGTIGDQRPQQEPYKPDCKKLLTDWLTNPRERMNRGHENVELTLRQIGRTDLARWLGYNIIHQRQLQAAEAERNCHQDLGRNMAVRYKGDDGFHRGSSQPVKLTADETGVKIGPTETVVQKVVITVAVVLSMTTLCLCCYKFLYGRMRGGHFTNYRNELDEESWLQQDRRECGGGSRSSCAKWSHSKKSWWNSSNGSKCKPFSAIEYLKHKFSGHADYSRDKRCRQLGLLITRLQKTCPTQRKILRLNRKEQNLLKSLTDAEKREFPATVSDMKFLVASDREKRKLLARECRREFLIELRKKMERIDPECKKSIALNETERKLIRKLSSSERLLLPIMDNDLELLVTNPLEKRRVTLRQMACKFAVISHEDRKYLELDNEDKKFLKELDCKEKKKLGITDSEFRFLVASESQKNLMQQRLESCERDQRIKEIRAKLAEVNFDVSLLELSKIEHSLFLSLNSYELAQLELTDEHVKFYSASDSERKVIWPSPSQYRNLRMNTLQTKLSKLPWKDCSTRLTSSEHALLASLTPREQDELHISDSEKNFMLSTDSKKELIQRQRKIEKLEAKIRDFNTITMTESERCLVLSLSPSEMQMLNIDSTNKSSLLEKKSHNTIDAGMRAKIEFIKDRIHREGLSNVRLTNSERCLIETLQFNSSMDSCSLTPSQLSFLLNRESGREMEHRGTNCGPQVVNRCNGSDTKDRSSTRDVQINTSPRIRHQETNCPSPLDCHVHSHSQSNDNHSNNPEFRHKVQFNVPEIYNEYDHQAFGQGSADDSGLSETYDELGMLFSQQMKQQSRPCQRKYCLLGRHLKRGRLHDERQCQMRHHCCRGYPSDQRPSCSSGNVCQDTYDEFQLLHARQPHEKRQLNSSMFERRKQFLDQPCQRCSITHDNCMKIN